MFRPANDNDQRMAMYYMQRGNLHCMADVIRSEEEEQLIMQEAMMLEQQQQQQQQQLWQQQHEPINTMYGTVPEEVNNMNAMKDNNNNDNDVLQRRDSIESLHSYKFPTQDGIEYDERNVHYNNNNNNNNNNRSNNTYYGGQSREKQSASAFTSFNNDKNNNYNNSKNLINDNFDEVNVQRVNNITKDNNVVAATAVVANNNHNNNLAIPSSFTFPSSSFVAPHQQQTIPTNSSSFTSSLPQPIFHNSSSSSPLRSIGNSTYNNNKNINNNNVSSLYTMSRTNSENDLNNDYVASSLYGNDVLDDAPLQQTSSFVTSENFGHNTNTLTNNAMYINDMHNLEKERQSMNATNNNYSNNKSEYNSQVQIPATRKLPTNAVMSSNNQYNTSKSDRNNVIMLENARKFKYNSERREGAATDTVSGTHSIYNSTPNYNNDNHIYEDNNNISSANAKNSNNNNSSNNNQLSEQTNQLNRINSLHRINSKPNLALERRERKMSSHSLYDNTELNAVSQTSMLNGRELPRKQSFILEPTSKRHV